MKKRITLLLMQFLLLFAMSSVASAQYYSTAPVQRVFSQQELDQMLAPIALYPDSLLSQILMASTYPPEVQQAADWSRSHPGWQGEQAVQAVQGYAWEPSVKSLVAFPQILSVMGDRMDWTANLGDAFLGQQQQVMDTIQYLRRKAVAAGTLRSDSQIRVSSQGNVISIEPVAAQTAYVPYYNPTYAYGSWWWPNYAPVYWDPWPGYYSPYGYNRGLVWGAGIPVGIGLFFGYFDWGHRHVYVRPHKRWHDGRHYDPKRRYEWRHRPEHRHGTPYRTDALRKRYDKPIRDRSESGSYRGRAPASSAVLTGNASRRRPSPSGKAPGVQEKARPTPTRASSQPPRATATPGQVGASSPSAARPIRPEQRPTAFEGIERGKNVRNFSERGRASASQAARSGSQNGIRGSQSVKPSSREQSASPAPSRRDGPPRGGRGGGRD